MTRARLALVALALLAIVPAATSCAGYSTHRLVDFGGARTISVLPFENTGFRRDLELRLTQAVAEEVRARTSLALSSADRADILLRGSMGADEQLVIQDQDRNPILKRLRGTLLVSVTDRRTGAVVRTYTVADATEFTPGRHGETLEGSATDDWVRRMAIRVVQGLETGF